MSVNFVLISYQSSKAILLILIKTVVLCTQEKIARCGKHPMFGTLFSLYSLTSELLVIRGGNKKICVRIANRDDPDQTASSKAV